jgi:hypothetical protein
MKTARAQKPDTKQDTGRKLCQKYCDNYKTCDKPYKLIDHHLQHSLQKRLDTPHLVCKHYSG